MGDTVNKHKSFYYHCVQKELKIKIKRTMGNNFKLKTIFNVHSNTTTISVSVSSDNVKVWYCDFTVENITTEPALGDTDNIRFVYFTVCN